VLHVSYPLDFGAAKLVGRRPMWVDHFSFEHDGSAPEILSLDGTRYTPESPEWETALLHTMAQYTIYIPTAAHNWVHFSLPDAAGSAALFDMRERADSTLVRLLSPHLRFTKHINHVAVVERRTVTRGTGPIDRLVPWNCMPVDKEDFPEGVVENTAKA